MRTERSLIMRTLLSLGLLLSLAACLGEVEDPRPKPMPSPDGGHFDPGRKPLPGGYGSGSGSGSGSPLLTQDAGLDMAIEDAQPTDAQPGRV